MAELKTRIQLRHDTEANWLAVQDSLIPLAGEACLTIDGANKGKVKYGDGSSTWGQLSYSGVDLTAEVEALEGKVTALETAVGSKGEESGITASDLWGAAKELKAAYEAADAAINNKFAEYYTKSETDAKIDEKIATQVSSTYKAAGSIDFASLPELAATEEGKVYNITDAFLTTENFIEGSGVSYPAGTNVVCIDSDDAGTYKWDVLAGFVDTSNFATKTELGNKVDKVVGSSLIQDSLIAKLTGMANIKGVVEGELAIASETGLLGVTAIDQSKVTGLSAALANKIHEVKVNGTALANDTGSVNIGLANASSAGVVVGSDAENKVKVNADGSMEVNNININKLVQTQGEYLILNGGLASDEEE